MATELSSGQETQSPNFAGVCEGCHRLLEDFGNAVRDVLRLNEAHFQAVINGEADPHRFEIMIHMANERKQNAKYAYVQHLESHNLLQA